MDLSNLWRRAPHVIRVALAAALLLSVLWVLAPLRSGDLRDGVVEIRYTGPGGIVQGALEDVIHEFERLSEARHRVDPRYPRYPQAGQRIAFSGIRSGLPAELHVTTQQFPPTGSAAPAAPAPCIRTR